jgi:hypothetical protein
MGRSTLVFFSPSPDSKIQSRVDRLKTKHRLGAGWPQRVGSGRMCWVAIIFSEHKESFFKRSVNTYLPKYFVDFLVPGQHNLSFAGSIFDLFSYAIGTKM